MMVNISVCSLNYNITSAFYVLLFLPCRQHWLSVVNIVWDYLLWALLPSVCLCTFLTCGLSEGQKLVLMQQNIISEVVFRVKFELIMVKVCVVVSLSTKKESE